MKYWKTKYQLAEDEVIILPHYHYGNISTDLIIIRPRVFGIAEMRIKKYFCWDGPSGPAVDTENFMLPSVVHDALYWLIRWELLPLSYRAVADDLMYDLCLRNGMFKIRAKYCCWAVKRFAKKAASPENKRIIYEVL